MISLWGVIKGLLVKGESDRSKQVSLEIDNSATTNTRTTIRASQTANRTLDLPDATDTLVGRATTETLSNKTLDNSNAITLEDSSFTLQDDADNTKQAQFNLSSLTTATTRTLSLPDANDTLAGIAATQTLTNKTIDATGTGTNTISIDADSVNFDNGVSGLSATDVQAALDEIDSNVDSVAANKLEGPGTHADNLLLKTDGVDTNTMQTTGISVDDSNNITGVNDLTTTGDVIIGGDLQVNGTLTSVNSTTLEVTDANVIVNNGGNQASANSQGAGFTVEMSDATDAAVSYDSTLATKFKVGEIGSQVEVVGTSSTQTLTNKTIDANSNTISNLAHGSEVDNPSSGVHGVTGNVVGTSDAQVLTNKDIDGGTASNTSRITIPKDTKANLDALTRKEGTIVYASDLDAFYGDDGSQLFEIGSGGEGGKNYFEGGNFEGGISLASTYDDGSAYVDGTGGTPSFISIAQNSSSPLAGGRDLAITKAIGDATDEGVSFLSQTIDRADYGKDLFLEFEYDFTDADYVSGDVQIKAYDVTNAAILPVVPVANLDDDSGLFKAKSKAYAKVLCSSTTAQVRVSLHMETDSNSGANWTGYVDDVKLGPNSVLIASVAGESVKYNSNSTQTLTNATFNIINYEDVVYDDNLRVTTGASWQYTAPRNGIYEIDASLNIQNSTAWTIGEAATLSLFVNGLERESLDTFYPETTGVNIAVTLHGSTNVKLNSGDTVSIRFFNGSGSNLTKSSDNLSNFININELARPGNVLSANEVALSSFAAKMYRTTSNQNITSLDPVKIIYNAIEFDDFGLANTSTGRITVPFSGYYRIEASAYLNNTTADETYQLQSHVNGASVAADFRRYSGGDLMLYISTPKYLNAGDYVEIFTNSSADTNYDIIANQTTTWFSVTALPNFNTFGAFGETEYYRVSPATTATTATADTYVDLSGAELTLGPGVWEIGYEAAVYIQRISGTSVGILANCAIRNSSNDVQVGTVGLLYNIQSNNDDWRVYDLTRSTFVTITTPTTYKLSIRCSGSAASATAQLVGQIDFTGSLSQPDNYTNLWAKRIR